MPQVGSFNMGAWKSIEMRTRKFIEASRCVDNVVVVGAVPSMDKLNDRVTIPSFLWSYVKCVHDVAVVLAPNIANILIKQFKLVTVFFTSEEMLPGVLRKIRDLENRVSRIQHLAGKTKAGNLSNQNYIRATIRTLKYGFEGSATEPPPEGKRLLLQMGCAGTVKIKECNPKISRATSTYTQKRKRRIFERENNMETNKAKIAKLNCEGK